MTEITAPDAEREPTDHESSEAEEEREESPVDDDTEDNELLTKNGLPPLPEGAPATGPEPLP